MSVPNSQIFTFIAIYIIPPNYDILIVYKSAFTGLYKDHADTMLSIL